MDAKNISVTDINIKTSFKRNLSKIFDFMIEKLVAYPFDLMSGWWEGITDNWSIFVKISIS